MPSTVTVLLPLPFEKGFDYVSDEALQPGQLVEAPFGNRSVSGVVWDAVPTGAVPAAKIKPVGHIYDLPPLPPSMLRFIHWTADYSMAPLGMVLKMVVPHGRLLAPEPDIAMVQPVEGSTAMGEDSPAAPVKMTKARRRVMEALAMQSTHWVTPHHLAEEAEVSESVIEGLVKAGLLIKQTAPASLPRQAVPSFQPVSLSAQQREAAAELTEKVKSGGFSVTLLDGVTGSGKTEVYFEAMRAALEAGRQVLVLLPEIALTSQWLERFEKRFGMTPALWHSGIAQAQRRKNWKGVLSGRIRVVAGARSALYLPFPELGLVVVDEEHDASYKQEEGVLYHARDMAVARAHLEDIPLVLASATPSLETLANVEQAKYTRCVLPERHGPAELPQMQLVDMRREKLAAGAWLSGSLTSALEETLAQGEQAILFLNRRGYAPLTLCRQCGHRFQCPHCSAWLVQHRHTIPTLRQSGLLCHHCGYAMPVPESCPACGSGEKLAPSGPGIERISEELLQAFPTVRIGVMTSDHLSGPEELERLIAQVEARAVDVLLGTQMVVKGHHFPYLTLVGVIEADAGLAGGDFRAAEQTFQLLHQVAGRAGRAQHPGRVLLQTYLPEQPVMQALAAHDRDGFYQEEKQRRRESRMPPYSRLAALIISSKKEELAARTARELAQCAPVADALRVLGPAPAPMALIRDHYRYRLLLHADKHFPIQRYIRQWLAALRIPSTVEVRVDIDPVSFY